MQFVVCGGRGGNEADLDSVEAYSSTPNFKTDIVYQIQKIFQVRCADRFLAELSVAAARSFGSVSCVL